MKKSKSQRSYKIVDEWKVLTTGQVAAICSVASRTVSKWLDRGEIKGWQLPVSNDRRFLAGDVLDFMEKNRIPMINVPKEMLEFRDVRMQ